MCFTFIGLLALLLSNNLKLPGNEANYGQYHNGKQYFIWDIWAMCMNRYDPTTNPTQRQALAGISQEAYSYSHEPTRKAVAFLLYRSAWSVHLELDLLMIVIKTNYSSAVVKDAERWLQWNPVDLLLVQCTPAWGCTECHLPATHLLPSFCSQDKTFPSPEWVCKTSN